MSDQGIVYVWEKEYLYNGGSEIEINKRENWEIQQLRNMPKVTEIYATHDQFAIVTDQENVCMWSPKEKVNPDIDDMEIIDMEAPMLNIVAFGEDVFILDENHVLWSMENGTQNFLKANVKSIVQGYKGLAIQMMDNENKVYIYNIDLFRHHYETITFAGKYEVNRIVFTDNISSVSFNGKVGVVCTDKQEFYRWGWREPTRYANVIVPAVTVYDEPVKINLVDAKYCMVIGENIIYLDERNEMFVWI